MNDYSERFDLAEYIYQIVEDEGSYKNAVRQNTAIRKMNIMKQLKSRRYNYVTTVLENLIGNDPLVKGDNIPRAYNSKFHSFLISAKRKHDEIQNIFEPERDKWSLKVRDKLSDLPIPFIFDFNKLTNLQLASILLALRDGDKIPYVDKDLLALGLKEEDIPMDKYRNDFSTMAIAQAINYVEYVNEYAPHIGQLYKMIGLYNYILFDDIRIASITYLDQEDLEDIVYNSPEELIAKRLFDVKIRLDLLSREAHNVDDFEYLSDKIKTCINELKNTNVDVEEYKAGILQLIENIKDFFGLDEYDLNRYYLNASKKSKEYKLLQLYLNLEKITHILNKDMFEPCFYKSKLDEEVLQQVKDTVDKKIIEEISGKKIDQISQEEVDQINERLDQIRKKLQDNLNRKDKDDTNPYSFGKVQWK